MQTIAFINMKGGVGKTTLAVNVAYALTFYHRKKVLLIDGDPQFNATQYLLTDKAYLAHLNDPKKGTIRDIFLPKMPGPVSTTTGTTKHSNKSKMALSDCTCTIYAHRGGPGRFDLLPSTLALIEADNLQRGGERRLKAYLQGKTSGYDYVLIDCPPTISMFTQAAILASEKYVVPVKPDPLSVVGLPLLEQWLESFTEDQGITLKQVGIIFTSVRMTNAMLGIMADLRQRTPKAVFGDYLGQATVMAESVAHHRPIFFYKPYSRAAAQIIGIAEEFLKRTGG